MCLFPTGFCWKSIESEKEKNEYKERRSMKNEAGAALLFLAPSVSAH